MTDFDKFHRAAPRSIAAALLVASVGLGIVGCGGGSSTTPKSSFLYCTNAFSYDISQFKIGSDGSLSTLAPNIGYTAPSGGFPGSESLVFDPSHKHAYLSNLGASVIDEYTVNPDATLTKFGTVTLDQGANSSEPSVVAFLPSGKFAYATSESATNHKLTEFSVNANGALTVIGTLLTGNDVGHIVVDPASRFLYVTSYFGNTVSQYPVKSDGTIGAAIASLPTGAGPFAGTLSPDGSTLYVTNLGSLRPPYLPTPSTVSEYHVDASGTLTTLGTVNTGTGAGFLTISPNGRFAYVGNLHDTTVMTFAIGSNGALTLLQTLPVGSGPVQITFAPPGQFAYIAVTGADFTAPSTAPSNVIIECRVNPDGMLIPFGSVNTGIGPDFLLVQTQ